MFDLSLPCPTCRSYLYFLTKVTIEPDDPEEHDATVVLPDIEAGENVSTV